MKNLHQFVASIIENGGATFNLVTGTSPTTGYVVSEAGFELRLKLFGDDLTKQILINSIVVNFIREFGFELNNPKNFIGGWIDGKHLYLDISRVYDNEHDALRMAVENKQKAYYSIDKDKTTYI
jgi:hypothetical protein